MEIKPKLRITAVVSYFPTSAQPHKGMPTFNQMRALTELADLTVCVLHPQYPNVRLFHPKTFLHRHVDPEYRIDGMKVTYIAYPALPLISRGLNGWSAARRALPIIRKTNPEVILSYIVYPEGYAALRVARRLGVPVLVGAVGSDLRCIPDPWTELMVKRTLKNADFVVTKSRELRTHAIRLGSTADRTKAIVNGCDGSIFYLMNRAEARRSLGVAMDSKLVVFTGRLVAVKGICELIEAVARLSATRQDLELAIIGDGPLEAELRTRSTEAGIANKVRFLGAQSPQTVARWLAASNLFCLPSYSEGYPNVVLEALATGRPVVASNVGGVPEILDADCGIMVPPADAAALTAGIQQALGRQWDEEAIARLHARTWTDMAYETLDLCASAVRTGTQERRVAVPVEC